MARVLIVDDSPTEVHILKTMLEGNGFETLVAETGEQGVEVARAEHPDCILMDIVLPGLNGFQATRQLSQGGGTSHIPVIMVTNKDQETDRVWGMRQGARDYVTKPVAEQDLVEKIQSVLNA